MLSWKRLTKIFRAFKVKAAKNEIQKLSTWDSQLVSLQGRCFAFFTCVISLSRNKPTCCGLKKVVAKSRAQVYFEQQILALLLVSHHQTHNLSQRNLLMLRDRLKVFVSRISPPYRLGSISVALSSTVVFFPQKELGPDERGLLSRTASRNRQTAKTFIFGSFVCLFQEK